MSEDLFNDFVKAAKAVQPKKFSDIFGEEMKKPAWYESIWWAFKRFVRGLVK